MDPIPIWPPKKTFSMKTSMGIFLLHYIPRIREHVAAEFGTTELKAQETLF